MPSSVASSSFSSSAAPCSSKRSPSPRRDERAAKRSNTTRKSDDPLFGHGETSLASARFITNLFSCPDVPSSGPVCPPLAHFIAYALHRTRLPHEVTLSALVLLARLKQRFPAARGSSGHRLFLSALALSSKMICDDTYSNASWKIVGQNMFRLTEVNQMEREFAGYLQWSLNVEHCELLEMERTLQSYGSSFMPPAAAAVPHLSASSAYLPSSIPMASSSSSSSPSTASASAQSAYPSPPFSPVSLSHSSTVSPASSLGSVTPPTAAVRSQAKHEDGAVRVAGEEEEEEDAAEDQAWY